LADNESVEYLSSELVLLGPWQRWWTCPNSTFSGSDRPKRT